LISLVVLVVAICAGLAALGFRGRISTVGVDLGTTFSVVGINNNGKIIIVEDKLGNKIFPSVVSFKDGGEILTAYAALPELSKHPENTIYNAKRFIGRSLESEETRLYASEHPFQVVSLANLSLPNGLPLSNFSQVGFRISATGHSPVGTVTPEDVGTLVLKFLLRTTAEFLGHAQVNKAVVAVPAKFDSSQRRATADCYRRAGLKVVWWYRYRQRTGTVPTLYRHRTINLTLYDTLSMLDLTTIIYLCTLSYHI
jgi:molecular chaperone DnaK (HSP70)